jgi:hypothetical protein
LAAIVQWLQTRKGPKKQRVQVFAASIANINKALAVKQITDPRTKLPDWAKKYLSVFDQKKAEALPSFCEVKTDYSIKLEKDAKEKKKEVL